VNAPLDPAPPVCRKCLYYIVTWDAHAPHACSALGFKSVKPPSLVVYENSGLNCQLFRERSLAVQQQER